MFKKEVFKTFSFWIGFGLILLVALGIWSGNTPDHWLYKAMRSPVTDHQQLWELMSVESVKWLLGFAGLFFIGWYNLRRQDAQAEKNRGLQQELALRQLDHQKELALANLNRADEKERHSRLTATINSYTQDRLKALFRCRELLRQIQALYLEMHLADKAFEKKEVIVKLLQVRAEMLLNSAAYFPGPKQFGTSNALESRLTRSYNDIQSLFIKSSEEGLSELYDIIMGHVQFIEKLVIHERRRQFICNSLPEDEWPEEVTDDLALFQRNANVVYETVSLSQELEAELERPTLTATVEEDQEENA